MPVQQESSKVILNGDGTQRNFSFNFKIFKAENIKVYTVSSEGIETEKTLGIDYTFSSEDVELGGTVTFGTAPLATEKVLIIRSIPLEQNANFRPVSGFPEEVITDSFDTSRMIDQDLQEQLDRCVKVDASSSTNPQVLANKVERIYDSIDEIDIVQENITDVNNVADNISGINTVASGIANVNAVGGSIANVNTVSGHVNEIDNVSDNIAVIGAAGANIDAIIAVNDNEDNINAVADNETNINTVADNILDVAAVGSNIDNVNTVSGMEPDISEVIDNKTNIDTVAGNISDISAVAADLVNIDAASTYAEHAEIWAEGTDEEVQAIGGTHSAKEWAALEGLRFKGTYSSGTSYSRNNFVSKSETGTTYFYLSLVNDNVGHPLTDTSYWSLLWSVSEGNVVYFASILGDPNDNTALRNLFEDFQNQLDVLEYSPRIIDFVATYADLLTYPTTAVVENDKIKVLEDETHDGKVSYYKWVITEDVGAWEYEGSEAQRYTAAQVDTLLTGYVPTARTIQGKALSTDVSLIQNEIPANRTTLTTSGTLVLEDLSTNYVAPTGAITFSLPTITDNTKFHQILVQINMTGVVSIDVGTTYYFNKTAPDLSEAGTYDLIWEYDGAHWVCGLLSKGVE